MAVTGNVFGLSLADTRALAPEEFAPQREAAMARLRNAGAHYVRRSTRIGTSFPW